MMVALGELTTQYPVRGAFVHHATRFLDPSIGFALGYNYYYSWAVRRSCGRASSVTRTTADSRRPPTGHHPDRGAFLLLLHRRVEPF